MRVRDVLVHKGGGVVTVRPDATCRDLLALLAQHNIGAVVVSPDGITVAGIVSERDVVRRLHDRGAAILDAPVEQIATLEVKTCHPEDSLDELRETMTMRPWSPRTASSASSASATWSRAPSANSRTRSST